MHGRLSMFLAMWFLWTSPAVLAQHALPTVVSTYCIPCHNARVAESNVVLDAAMPSGRGPRRTLWERVLRQLRARTMPPTDNPRPDPKTYEALVSELASALDRGDPKKPGAAPRSA